MTNMKSMSISNHVIQISSYSLASSFLIDPSARNARKGPTDLTRAIFRSGFSRSRHSRDFSRRPQGTRGGGLNPVHVSVRFGISKSSPERGIAGSLTHRGHCLRSNAGRASRAKRLEPGVLGSSQPSWNTGHGSVGKWKSIVFLRLVLLQADAPVLSRAGSTRPRPRRAALCTCNGDTHTGKADGRRRRWGGGGAGRRAGGVADPVSLCSAGVGGGIAVHAPETPLISSQFVSAIFQPIANATTGRASPPSIVICMPSSRGGRQGSGGRWGGSEDRLVARMRRGRAGNSQRRAIKTFGGWESSARCRRDWSIHRGVVQLLVHVVVAPHDIVPMSLCAIADSFRAGFSIRLISPPVEELRAARIHERSSAWTCSSSDLIARILLLRTLTMKKCFRQNASRGQRNHAR